MRKSVGLLVMCMVIAVAIGALGCAEKPQPTPTYTLIPAPTPVPEPPIPSDFTIYTDEANKFSISYPTDWAHGANLIGTTYPTLSTERRFVFIAARITEGQLQCPPEVSSGWNPRIDVEVGLRPEGADTLDAVLKTEKRGIGNPAIMLDYHEFSRIETIINGKEAAIIEYEANFARSCGSLGQDYYLQMFVPYGNKVWIVTCTTWAQWYGDFDNSFYQMIESFKVWE